MSAAKIDLANKYRAKADAYEKMELLYKMRGASDPKSRALSKQYQLLKELAVEVCGDFQKL